MSAVCPLFGFIIHLRDIDAREAASLLDALRRELLEERGLLLLDAETANTYIVTGDGFQATDADREAVLAWLAARRLTRDYIVGALDDVGHAA